MNRREFLQVWAAAVGAAALPALPAIVWEPIPSEEQVNAALQKVWNDSCREIVPIEEWSEGVRPDHSADEWRYYFMMPARQMGKSL